MEDKIPVFKNEKREIGIYKQILWSLKSAGKEYIETVGHYERPIFKS